MDSNADAYLSAAGHLRPGMSKGLPLPEAQAKAAAIASGSVPSIVIPGMPYPAALSANTRAAEFSGTGVESAV